MVIIGALILAAVVAPPVAFWIAKFAQMGRMAGHKAFVDSCKGDKNGEG